MAKMNPYSSKFPELYHAQEISNAVRVFNTKLTNAKKKYPEYSNVLPDPISAADITEFEGYGGQIIKRNWEEMKREIKRLQRFEFKGKSDITVNEEGIAFTKYEIREMKNQVRGINMKRAEARARHNIKPIKNETYEDKNSEYSKLNFDVNRFKNRQQFKAFRARKQKESSSKFKNIAAEQYKKNWIATWYDYIVQDELTTEIVERIKKIPAVTFFKLSERYPEFTIHYEYIVWKNHEKAVNIKMRLDEVLNESDEIKKEYQ